MDDKSVNEKSGETRYEGSIKYVYLVPQTHLDIGFTGPKDSVAIDYKRGIDHAIRLVEENDDFKYTIESFWQLEEWLKRSDDPREVKKLVELIREERIDLAAAYATMHSGVMGYEEINRLIYSAALFAEKNGLTVDAVWQNDVPGFTWSYPQVLAKSGIKYMPTGLNLEYGGGAGLRGKDRIFIWEGPEGSRVYGWLADSYLESAFKWGLSRWDEEKTEERVLARLKEIEESGYPYDAFLVPASSGDNMDAIILLGAIDAVRKWNARHESPKMIFANARDFFRHMEERYGDQINTYRGDWSGYWETVKLSAPLSVSRYRWARDHAPAIETLSVINETLNRSLSEMVEKAAVEAAEAKDSTGSGSSQGSGEGAFGRGVFGTKLERFLNFGVSSPYDLRRMYDAIITYAEHSAGSGAGWPELTTEEQVNWSNDLHYFDASTAFHTARWLLERSLSGLCYKIDSDKPTIVVYNPLSFSRGGVVEVQMHRMAFERDFKIKDAETGKIIPFEKSKKAYRIEFYVDSVPSIGYRLFDIEFAEAESAEKKSAEADSAPAAQDGVSAGQGLGEGVGAGDLSSGRDFIENRFYSIKVDIASGEIVSIIDKKDSRNLINERLSSFFNKFAKFRGGSLLGRRKPEVFGIPASGVNIISDNTKASITIERRGSIFPSTVITLFTNQDRIDISNTIDMWTIHERSRDGGSDTYGFVFGFDINYGDASLRYEGPSCEVDVNKDFLPEAKPWIYTPQHYISLISPQGKGVILFNKDAALADASSFKSIPGGNEDYSMIYALMASSGAYGMAKDRGLVFYERREPLPNSLLEFRYAIKGVDGDYSSIDAVRLGWEFNLPLTGDIRHGRFGVKGILGDKSRSFISIDNPGVILLAAKKAEDGSENEYILRFLEIGGKKESFTVKLPFEVRSASLAMITERPIGSLKAAAIQGDALRLDIGAHEVLTIRVRV